MGIGLKVGIGIGHVDLVATGQPRQGHDPLDHSHARSRLRVPIGTLKLRCHRGRSIHPVRSFKTRDNDKLRRSTSPEAARRSSNFTHPSSAGEQAAKRPSISPRREFHQRQVTTATLPSCPLRQRETEGHILIRRVPISTAKTARHAPSHPKTPPPRSRFRVAMQFSALPRTSRRISPALTAHPEDRRRPRLVRFRPPPSVLHPASPAARRGPWVRHRFQTRLRSPQARDAP